MLNRSGKITIAFTKIFTSQTCTHSCTYYHILLTGKLKYICCFLNRHGVKSVNNIFAPSRKNGLLLNKSIFHYWFCSSDITGVNLMSRHLEGAS